MRKTLKIIILSLLIANVAHSKTQEEKKAHDDFVDTLGDDSIWKKAYK